MAANARALGYCFNPISVHWCFDGAGDLAAVVVEVHNTYGDRHAYLVHPDEQGRARADKAMYVSPFHGADGVYELAVPIPGDRLHIAVTLHSDGRHRRRRRLQRDRLGYRILRGPAPRRTCRPARHGADPSSRHLALGAAAPDATPPRPPATGGSLPTTLHAPTNLDPRLARTRSGAHRPARHDLGAPGPPALRGSGRPASSHRPPRRLRHRAGPGGPAMTWSVLRSSSPASAPPG